MHATSEETRHMAPDNEESLERELEHAENKLRSALDSACESDVDDVDTGELIRIEEVLAIANEAAKDAVSIRRKRRGGRQTPANRSTEAQTSEGQPVADPARRRFTDATGRQWDVFAVHPGQGKRAPILPEPFRTGWLAFESGPETRRLAPIPDAWTRLSDKALAQLNERAEPARRSVKRSDQARPPEQT
jgi:hypothetical protein